MNDADPRPAAPLSYARPGTVPPGRRPIGRFEQIATCVVWGLIGACLAYWGVACWGAARPMVQGFGERDRLIHAGWVLIVAGGLTMAWCLHTLRRRTR